MRVRANEIASPATAHNQNYKIGSQDDDRVEGFRESVLRLFNYIKGKIGGDEKYGCKIYFTQKLYH